MSEFEIVSVVLSFIIGLGVAQILSAVVFAIHSRRETALRWGPLLWALAILLFHLNFLFAAFQFYNADVTLQGYLLDLLSAVLLFLSGGLILPSESRQALEGLDHFFERDGKLALVPLVLFLLVSIPYNILGGLPVVASDNLVLLCLVALGAITFFFPGRLRGASTVAFTVLTTYAFFFIWARPGVS